MKEELGGLTAPEVTAITVEPCPAGWRVTIEQGNAHVLKCMELTPMERGQLSALLSEDPRNAPHAAHFVDATR